MSQATSFSVAAGDSPSSWRVYVVAGSVVGSVPLDGPSAVDHKLAALQTAFECWRTVPLPERRRIVEEGLSRFLDEATRTARRTVSRATA